VPAGKDFFDEPREQSLVKSRIVTKYFESWATVIIPRVRVRGQRLLYMDLFAGPGRYRDGTPSTPIVVLQKAISNAELRKMLVTVFNDKDRENSEQLKEAIKALPGVETLTYEPQVENEEVGEKLVSVLESMRLIPTLLFVDPWGYKGLSLALINSVLQNWGSDCVFFFNYNRINPGLNNPIVDERMNDVFGVTRAGMIRERLMGLQPREREFLIVEEMSQALKGLGAKYVLPFTFKNEEGTRTQQYLIFASKNPTGYKVMKDIMAKESTEQNQGVPSFIYSPASRKWPFLFELHRPLDDLEGLLLEEFAGHRLTMKEIYERHNVDRPYIESNYKSVLSSMESAGKIQAVPSAQNRRAGTFGDDVLVIFPKGARK
jgi:three-Cys-motif partner protein